MKRLRPEQAICLRRWGVAVVALLCVPALVAESQPQPQIHLEKQRLSVAVSQGEVLPVLQRIAELAGIDLENTELLANRPVAVHFTELPLLRGLRRVLQVAGIRNYAVVSRRVNGRRTIERVIFVGAYVPQRRPRRPTRRVRRHSRALRR
jgi:hypothetical protein